MLLLVTQAPEQPDPEVQKLLGEAAAARDAGDLEGALEVMRKAYALAPAPELLNNVGYLLQQLGRYREAFAVYERVLNDPGADAELLELQKARLAGLEHKLDRSWVECDPSLSSRLLVDGSPADARTGEIALGPTTHTFELTAGDSVLISWRKFPPGVRSRLDPAALEPKGRAAILIDDRVDALRVDGYGVRGLDKKRVLVEPGKRRLAVRLSGRGEVRQDANLRAGDVLSIAEQFKPTAQATAVLPPPEGPSVLPPLTLALGAAVALAGGGLLIAAEMDRSAVRSAERNEEGLIVGLTYPEAVRLNDRSTDRTTAGAVVLSVGGAALVAGLIWWLFD